MIGLQPSQQRQQPAGHATDRQTQQRLDRKANSGQQHEQVFRANLVRVPSKAGSPMVNLSHYAQQQQDRLQQQQQPRRRRTNTTTSDLLPGHLVEAVAGRSVMVAEPVQRQPLDGGGGDSRAATNQGPEVLLLIDEHSGEAPIVISQRTGRPVAPSGGRATSKTRQQLELLRAAADYKTIAQGDSANSAGGAIILAPVVLGRRSHRLQQQQQQQQRHEQQQQARYLFGEFAQEVESQGVELRQHVLRPIGVLEQIPAAASLSPNSSSSNNNLVRLANVSNSDGSRRSTTSSSSSSGSSSNSDRRKLRAPKYHQHERRFNSVSSLDIPSSSAAEYRLYEGTRFSAVPEYAIAIAVADRHRHHVDSEATKLNVKQTGPAKSGKKKLAAATSKQQQLLLKSCSPQIIFGARPDCDTDSSVASYCCSDPSCRFATPPPPVNYATKPKLAAPLMRSVSCQKIVPSRGGCCAEAEAAHRMVVDHHFCQANGHSHPDYLPPLNRLAASNGRPGGSHSGSGYGSSSQAIYSSATGSHSSPNGSQTSATSTSGQTTSDLEHDECTSGSAVEQMYESLAAELKAKLGNPRIGPILLPPRDYDTLCRKQGKLDGIELRRSTNPQLVGPILPDTVGGPNKRQASHDSSSSGNSSLKSNV